MGVNSKIEWTDHTFNPWIGCTKVSSGCQHCYAEALMDTRYGTVQWGARGTRKRTSPANWRKPLAWNRQEWWECRDCGYRGNVSTFDDYCPRCRKSNCYPTRQRVFCASLADVFEDRPELAEWRRDMVVMMEKTPNLDWLLLTKRPENVTRMINKTITIDPDIWWLGMPNVWLGTSVEDQKTADTRIPHLLQIPARVRFLSMEPLLGPVDLSKWIGDMDCGRCRIRFFSDECPKCGTRDDDYDSVGFAENAVEPYSDLHWVIVGGESGPNARPMHPDWVRSIRDQCQMTDTPFLFKQWGEWYPDKKGIYEGKDTAIFGNTVVHKLGKKAAGRSLDGREWSEYPQ